MKAQPVQENPASGGPEVFLHPGEYHFGSAPGVIRTLLGSCVSVTVWHPGLRLGGMCHALLPSRVRRRGDPLEGRFVDEAIEILREALRVRGVSPGACKVKLFGGGNMFAPPAADLDVGVRNIEAARRHLAANGFAVIREDVGGNRPRRLSFDLATGRVWHSLTARVDIAAKDAR